MAAQREGLTPHVIGRRDRRCWWRQARIAMKLKPRPSRDQGGIGGIDNFPADLLVRRGLDLTAEGRTHGLRAETDSQDWHTGLIDVAQPGQLLLDPQAWRSALVDRRDGA